MQFVVPLLSLLSLLDVPVGARRYQFSATEVSCPTHVDRRIFFHNREMLKQGHAFRAFLSLPPSFELRASGIPGAGLGVFSRTFVRAHTWLGEYEGEFLLLNVTSQEGYDQSYMWLIYYNNRPALAVDAANVSLSNWLRWVNCARSPAEENVSAEMCLGRVYYRLMRDVRPREELLVYYGHGYARSLGIDHRPFHERRLLIGPRCE